MSNSNEETLLTKINTLISNEINEEIILLIVAKSENKFPNCIRYNTLFSDGNGEFISCQTFKEDLFKDHSLNDTIIMKKYIVLLSVDDKGFLPLNKQGYKLDTAVSTIETLNKKTNIVKDLFIDSIDVLANISDASVKLFKNVKGVILNKTVSYPNNKIMVKYELANEIFNCGIHLILWNNDLLIEDNYLYTFKFVNVDKYNKGLQLSFNHFTKFEKGKKISKINISNNFVHLSQNIEKSVLYSQYEMFYMHSHGFLIGKILDVNKKKEFFFQLKVCSYMDDRQKILFISTFDRGNLFPYITYSDKEVDKKMLSLIGTEKKFSISVKKVNEKLFFNVVSIYNNH